MTGSRQILLQRIKVWAQKTLLGSDSLFRCILIRDLETGFVILICEHSGILKLKLYILEEGESLMNSFRGSSLNLALELEQKLNMQ